MICQRAVAANQETRPVLGITLGYRDQAVMGLVDGSDRIVRRMHIGKVIARGCKILAHLHVLVHVFDPHRAPQQLGKVVGYLPVPFAHFGGRNPIGHPFVDPEHERLGRDLSVHDERCQQQGK